MNNILAQINPNLEYLSPYQPAKSFIELQRELTHATDIIKLGNNENPLGASPKIKPTLHKLLDDISLYPDPTAHHLRDALSQHLQVSADAIIQGNGSADVLAMLAQTFLSPGDHVIIPQHSFALFEVITHLAGAKCELVPLKNWAVDPAAIVQACCSNTKMIFIANPGNPTGTALTHQDLSFLLNHIPSSTLLIWDEAYHEFDVSSNKPNALSLLPKYKNLVITRTFSKAYGLAGLRIGYGIADSNIIAAMNRIRLSYNLNFLAELAASIALNDSAHLIKTINHNREQKHLLESELNKIGLTCLASATNFLTITLNERARPIYEKLLASGIITRSLDHYGMPNHLGVTIGTTENNQQFLSALKPIIRVC